MNKYELATRLTLHDKDGFTGRITANEQRELFGRVIFGRKRVTIDCSGQGRVYGTYSCAFGTDSAYFDYSFDRIAELANNPSLVPTF